MATKKIAGAKRPAKSAGTKAAAKAPTKSSQAKKSSAKKTSTKALAKKTPAKSSSTKAAAKKGSGRRYSPAAGAQVAREMREMKAGTLTSGGSGQKVTNPKQAIAIGLSEARRAGKKVPPDPNRSKK